MPTARAHTGLAIASALLLSACASFANKPMLATPTPEAQAIPKNIVIFFDGTHNDIASDTNIKRLHSLVTLQDRHDISSLYIEGVGIDNDILGMSTGIGIGKRVRLAYAFLLNNYHVGDHIYLFGFSRGAYSARILASLLNDVGLPDKPVDATPDRDAQQHATQIAESAYSNMKTSFEAGNPPSHTNGYATAPITMLGLWDTVEALGIPDWYHRILHKTGIAPYQVNIDIPNARYGDQLCNVQHAFQALSIDDDREWIFTPLPLGRDHLYTHCPLAQRQDIHLPEEVWFSGAHSDVGGGYADSELSGVSLNWMISVMERDHLSLLPTGTRVRQDPFGTSHDPEAGWWAPLYHQVNRNIAAYNLRGLNHNNTQQPTLALAGKLCVHPSVFQRRQAMPPKDHENTLLRLQKPDAICLQTSPALGKPAILQEVDCSQPHAYMLDVQQWGTQCGGDMP